MSTRVEQYLAALDERSGGREPRFYPVEPQPGGQKVTSIVYDDLPEPGMLVGLTYGLSLADHPDWRLGRPELCIAMRSADPSWALAVAHLAATLADDCPFAYGDTIRFGEPIAGDTTMDAFVVFAPAVLDRDQFLNVLGAPEGAPTADVIHLAGMYPVHESERQYIETEGLEAFWNLDWDPYDPGRAPAV